LTPLISKKANSESKTDTCCSILPFPCPINGRYGGNALKGAVNTGPSAQCHIENHHHRKTNHGCHGYRINIGFFSLRFRLNCKVFLRENNGKDAKWKQERRLTGNFPDIIFLTVVFTFFI